MMFLLHSRNIFLSATSILILLLVSLEPIGSLRNPMRSVETCDTVPEFNLQDLTADITSCRLFCEKKYMNIDKSTKNANLGLAEFQIKSLDQGRTSKCCCRFNTIWPDYVKPIAIGRKDWSKLKTAKSIDCLPLVLKVRLSKRTANSYQVLCSHLNKDIPLTMLELMEFAKVAAYLNYIQPKHPFLIKTLRLKEVAVINQPIQEQLAEIFDTSLLNSYKPLEQYDGYKLELGQIAEFYNMMGKLQNALRSRVIAKAFDEYIMSYIMVDIAAAYKYLDELNKSLGIPDRILNGDYDKYSQDAMDYDFALENVNCRSLMKTETKLDRYLSKVQSTLATLYEKLIYEHMCEQYKYLQQLVYFKQIYKSIAKVNCREGNNKQKIANQSSG